MGILFYGTRFYGKTKYFKGQGITTKFGHLWFLPFVPMQSYYVLEENSDGIKGYDIPLNGLSILKSYIQWWTPAISLLLIFLGIEARTNTDLIQIAVGAAGLLAWICMLIFLKEDNDPKRMKQRRVFGSVIKGIYAHPSMLPPNMRSDLLMQLQNNWEVMSKTYSLKSWEHTTASALRQMQGSPGYEKLPNLLYVIHLLYKEIHKTDKYDTIIEEIEPVVLDSLEENPYTANVKETISCPHCFTNKIPSHEVKCPHCNKKLSMKKSDLDETKTKNQSVSDSWTKSNDIIGKMTRG